MTQRAGNVAIPPALLWLGSAAIARQLGYNAKVFTREIACAPGFPKPSTARDGARPRWNVLEVHDYMMRRRDSHTPEL